MNTVLTFLEANRQRLELDHYGAAGRMACVMVTPRFRASSHVVFLLLPHGASEPALVAKVPRIAGASASLEREAANLRACQATRPGGFDSIPRVIAFEEFCGHPVLVETALVGQPIDPAAIRRDPAGACTTVTAWLAELQRAQPVNANDDFERLVEQPLQRLAETLLSEEDTRLLERTRALVAPLRGACLPLVFEHGDLSHPNVMRLRSGGAGVVDWELADPHGLPACDLFFFLTYAAFARHGARTNADYMAAFHTAFFGRAAWARPYVLACAERLDLPPDALTPLFVVCWARYLSGLLLRIGAGGSGGTPLGGDTAAWLRTNRYYTLWRHTLDHAHELDWHDLPPARSS